MVKNRHAKRTKLIKQRKQFLGINTSVHLRFPRAFQLMLNRNCLQSLSLVKLDLLK